MLDVFEKTTVLFKLTGIYSHIETGLGVTYLRDQKVADWCHAQNIQWIEYRQQGVFPRPAQPQAMDQTLDRIYESASSPFSPQKKAG